MSLEFDGTRSSWFRLSDLLENLDGKTGVEATVMKSLIELNHTYLRQGVVDDLFAAVLSSTNLKDITAYSFLFETFKYTGERKLLLMLVLKAICELLNGQLKLANVFKRKPRAMVCFLEQCLYVLPETETEYIVTFLNTVCNNFLATSLSHQYNVSAKLAITRDIATKRMQNIPELDLADIVPGLTKHKETKENKTSHIVNSKSKQADTIVKNSSEVVVSPTKNSVQPSSQSSLTPYSTFVPNNTSKRTPTEANRVTRITTQVDVNPQQLAVVIKSPILRVHFGGKKIKYSWVVRNKTPFDWPPNPRLNYMGKNTISCNIGLSSATVQPLTGFQQTQISVIFACPNEIGNHFLRFRLSTSSPEDVKNNTFFGQELIATVQVARCNPKTNPTIELQRFCQALQQDSLCSIARLNVLEELRLKRLKLAALQSVKEVTKRLQTSYTQIIAPAH